MDAFPWTFLPVENCATRGGRYRWKTLPSLAFFPGHEKRTKTTSHVQIGGGKNEDLSALLLGMMIDCIVCAFELKKPGGGTINLPIFGNLPLLWGSTRSSSLAWLCFFLHFIFHVLQQCEKRDTRVNIMMKIPWRVTVIHLWNEDKVEIGKMLQRTAESSALIYFMAMHEGKCRGILGKIFSVIWGHHVEFKTKKYSRSKAIYCWFVMSIFDPLTTSF